MAERRLPLVGYHFFVEVSGILTGPFQQAEGLTSESEKIEYKASGPRGEEITISQPGRTKYPNITLKRGLTDSPQFKEWRPVFSGGQITVARKNLSIKLFDHAGETVNGADGKPVTVRQISDEQRPLHTPRDRPRVVQHDIERDLGRVFITKHHHPE